MEYIVNKIEGRPKDAPEKYEVSFIETVKDISDRDFQVSRFIGNLTIEHLEGQKLIHQEEINKIDEMINAIKNTKI